MPRKLFAVIECNGVAFVFMGTQQTLCHSRYTIGMFAALMIMIIGPELFTFVLGARWSEAGIYAQILAPWFFVDFISSPLLAIFNVLEKQGTSLWFNALIFISRVIVIIFAGLSGDPVAAFLLLSGTGVILWTSMNMYSLKLAGVSVREALREIMRYLFLGLFVSSPLIIAKYYLLPTISLMLIAIGVSGIYYLIIVLSDEQLKKGLLNSLAKIIPQRYLNGKYRRYF